MLSGWLPLMYLVLVPVTLLTLPLSNHDAARVAQVMLCGACAIGVSLALSRKGAAKFSTGGAAAFAGISVLALASIANADSSSYAAREFALYAGLACIASCVASMASARGQDCLLAGTTAASALYSAVVLLLVAAICMQGQPLLRGDLFVGYDNYRFYTHVQTVALPLLVAAVSALHASRAVATVAWFALVVGFSSLVFAVGRGTLLGLSIAALLAFCLFGRRAARSLVRMSTGAVCGAVLYTLMFVLLPLAAGSMTPSAAQEPFAHLQADNSRFYLWNIALAHVESAPWVGIGPMHFAHHPNLKAAHPHNIYLQVAAEWGLPMLLALLALAGWGLMRLTVAVRRCPDAAWTQIGVCLWMACIAVAVDGAFSAAWVMPVPQVWIAALVGWSIAWTRQSGGMRSASERSPPLCTALRVGIGAALVATQASLAVAILPEAMELDVYLQRAEDLVQNPKINPRFWSNGWF